MSGICKRENFEFYDFKNYSNATIKETEQMVEIVDLESLTYSGLTFKIDKLVYFKGACLSAYLKGEKVLTLKCNKVDIGNTGSSGGFTLKIQNVVQKEKWNERKNYVDFDGYTMYLNLRKHEELEEFKEGDFVLSKDKIEETGDRLFTRYTFAFNMASIKDEDIANIKPWNKVPTRKEFYDLLKKELALEIIKIEDDLLLVKDREGKTFYINQSGTYKFDNVINEGETFGNRIRELVQAKRNGTLDEYLDKIDRGASD